MAICPHKQDYCDKCAKFNAKVHAKRTTLNWIRQSGSASVEDQQQLEKEIQDLKGLHEDHRKISQLSDEDHVTLIMQRKEQMEKINILAEKSNWLAWGTCSQCWLSNVETTTQLGTCTPIRINLLSPKIEFFLILSLNLCKIMNYY